MTYSRIDANDIVLENPESRGRHEHDLVGKKPVGEYHHTSPGKGRTFLIDDKIFLFASMISIPLLLLSAVVIGIIIHNRVEQSQSSLPTSSSIAQEDQNVYYVDFSATRLVLLASFSSSIVGFLITIFMSLLSYPIASRMFKLSGKHNFEQLPTTHQFSLIILSLYGGFCALWDWVKYIWTRKSSEKIPDMARLSFVGLIVANVLGYITLTSG